MNRRWPLYLVLFAMLARVPAWAQEPVAEYALKAALLFKLPQFVYQPDVRRAPEFRLCLLGNNPFGSAPERLARNAIDNRPVHVIRLGSTTDGNDCDFVFIARSEAGNLDAILQRWRKHPAVTVSDIDGFARAGGMVELALGGEGTAVSILINRKAAQRHNVEFNAQLLRLAKVVEP